MLRKKEALAILVVAALCLLALVWPKAAGEIAVVTRDGAVVARMPLNEHAELSVAGGVIQTGGGAVWMREADCPGQECVRQGAISKAGQRIVCLPGRIIIRIEGGTSTDAVTY